jgi:cellulose synthase/poly-beta-1,6-N-acetylglucosamine synthase-like glycosyltransferase
MTEENNNINIESNTETQEPVKKETRGRKKIPDELKKPKKEKPKKEKQTKVIEKNEFKKLFKMPLISIIMPNYKSQMLEKSIKSILKQDYPNIEFIII